MAQRDEHDGQVGDISVGDVPASAILRSILDLTDDAVITCDQGYVSYFSENAERLFGRSAEDAVGWPLSALFAPHLSDEMDRVSASVTAGERIRHFETEIVRPDGLPVPVSLSLAPVTDDHGAFQGAIVGSVVVVRDVTEQHLAQAMLAEIDARLEESEALAHVGSWLWDLRTGAVQWSSEFHRIHGIDPLDFAGTFESYMDLIDEADRGATRAAMFESVEASRPLDLEYRVAHPDQKLHIIHVHANPILGSDDKAVGLRGIGQDVTDETGPSSEETQAG